MKLIPVLLLMMLLLTGCSSLFEDPKIRGSSEINEMNQTTLKEAENLALQNKDIFVRLPGIYINAENIEWVQNLKLTPNNQAGVWVIDKKYEKGEPFAELMATKLPLGTKVYRPVENYDVLLAEVNGKEIRYVRVDIKK